MKRRAFNSPMANLSLMLGTPGRVVAWTLLVLVALVAPSATLFTDGKTHAEPSRTAKERLGSKASDEQGSTIARSQSTCVARSRGRTNAAMAQVQGRSLVAGLVMRNRLPSLISS